MGKVNYARVEQRLMQGLRKMFVDRLQEVADKTALAISEDEQAELTYIHADLRKLNQEEKEVHKKLGISKEDLKGLVDNPEALSEKEWAKLKELKQAIEKESQEIKKQLQGEHKNDDLVELERDLHKYKRFNVRPGWVPLDTHAPPPPKLKRKRGSWDIEEE